MISANELRIGNIVNTGKYEQAAFAITTDHVTVDMAMCLADVPIENINSVPLSEGWLIRFGFERTGNDYTFIKSVQEHGLKKLVLVYEMIDYKINWIVAFADYYTGQEKTELFPKGIQYVHQLQNLHFALTGTELPLK